MSLCVSFIFYLIVCCFSVIWALLPEMNVMGGWNALNPNLEVGERRFLASH